MVVRGFLSWLQRRQQALERQWLEKPYKVVRKAGVLAAFLMMPFFLVTFVRQRHAVYEVLNAASIANTEVYLVSTPSDEHVTCTPIVDVGLLGDLIVTLQPNDLDWERSGLYDIFMQLDVIVGGRIVRVGVVKNYGDPTIYLDARVKGRIGFAHTWHVSDETHVIDRIEQMGSHSAAVGECVTRL